MVHYRYDGLSNALSYLEPGANSSVVIRCGTQPIILIVSIKHQPHPNVIIAWKERENSHTMS